jgi:hypothetical protein
MGVDTAMMKRALDVAQTKETRFVLVSSYNDIGMHQRLCDDLKREEAKDSPC